MKLPPDFSTAQILVFGDVMLDRYCHGATSRISPEAPVPVVKVNDQEARPGGAANVALNIAALGGQTTLLGIIGDDEPGKLLRENLHKQGVDCRFYQHPACATITKLRVVSRQQQLIRVDFEDGFPNVDIQQVQQSFAEALIDCQVVVLSDYGKGTLADVQHFIQTCRTAGKVVLVDPKGKDFSRYRGATLITPNLAEFEAIVGTCADEQALVEKGLHLLADYELNALLVTRGEQGMTLLQAGQEPFHLPTQAREVFDVTGAGDTVISTLAAALAAQQSLPNATQWANLAAGIVVGKLGTATASPKELEHALAAQQATDHGVVNEIALMQALAAAVR